MPRSRAPAAGVFFWTAPPSSYLQGAFQDTDGSLLNNQTLPPALLPGGGSNASLTPGPNSTLVSAIGNLLLPPQQCVYFNSVTGAAVDVTNLTAAVPGQPPVADAAWCTPNVTFRRLQVGGHVLALGCPRARTGNMRGNEVGAPCDRVPGAAPCPNISPTSVTQCNLDS